LFAGIIPPVVAFKFLHKACFYFSLLLKFPVTLAILQWDEKKEPK